MQTRTYGMTSRHSLINWFPTVPPISSIPSKVPDDMSAHIKASLIGSSVTIPIKNHRLNLGTWQGVYLCEFRDGGDTRKLSITIL